MASNWRKPSAQHMQKYGLVPLPDDFEPTEEENILLEMYETIRATERAAARLKEEAARAKLAAKDAEFQERNAPKRKTNRKKEQKAHVVGGRDDDDDDSDDHNEQQASDEEPEDDEEDPQVLYERREAKLAALREEVEEKKQAVQAKELEDDALRAQLLADADDTLDEGPLLKRKRVATNEPTSSLIANMAAAATPPHDFSSKLGLSKGKVLFPTSLDEAKWTPPEGVFSPNDGAFEVILEKFDVVRAQNGLGNNTLAIKFMAPTDAKRFSLNIATPDHNSFDSVLFHFNPRQFERGGQLVINDKQEGTWGQAIAVPLSQVPLMFGQTSCTLIIQINGEGFDIFLENKHCARLEHRVELPENTDLVLQFPSTDDYGKPESWTVYKVWWGNRPIMAQEDVSGVAGVNTHDSMHPRKLFISGLSKIFTESEVELRRAELERAFRKYGGDRGVHVIVPKNSKFAFVEMETERQADLALAEMSGTYRMNRARRSRHEALQEQRAAAEAAKQGGKSEVKEWD